MSFDVAIIGAGPGGYVAAIRAAQLGLKTVCIEKRKVLGGTCLNVGCIPSKALLQSSYKFYDANKHFTEHGINIKNLSADIKKVKERKNKVVSGLTQGIEMLFKKNKISKITGTAKIIEKGKIEVSLNDGKKEIIEAKNIIIATGSVPTSLPNIEIDEDVIVSSTGALDFEKTPKHLVVIGGGVIGLELGSVWSRYGSKVTVLEFFDTITPGLDKDITKQFTRSLKKQGLEIKTKTKVLSVNKKGKKASIEIEPAKGGDKTIIDCDKVLVCVGRKPFTDNLGIAELGVKTNDRGFIEIDTNFKTNIDGIYAIGDAIPGPMLAHKAEEEGVACVEKLAGENGHINYNNIPSVVYTHPEIASTGKTEEQLKEENIEYKVGKFPFLANSRAKAIGETDGFVKIIAEKTTDKILGVHIIGPEAGNLIHEAVIIMEYGGNVSDLISCCHAHPTFNEAVREAALNVNKRSIHI